MSEKAITRNIMAWLKEHEIFALKMHGSPLMTAGIPDILAIPDGAAWFIEVKTPQGKATQLQIVMMERLRKAGAYCLLARSIQDVEGYYGQHFQSVQCRQRR